MLLYNVCYLAYTQGIEIPLSQAGDVLSNLWSVCCSAELGRSVESPPSVSGHSFVLIDAAAPIKHIHYFRRLHRRASHSTLHNYSRLLLPPPHRDRARRAHARRGKLRLGTRYPKRTSGTCWTVTKQVLPNFPNTSISTSRIAYSPFATVLCNIALQCSIPNARLYHTLHPTRILFVRPGP